MSHKIDFATVVPKFLALAAKGFCRGEMRCDPTTDLSVRFCVERAISEAFERGKLDKDQPHCVSADISQLKIDINDGGRWASDKQRARGLRRLGIAQLGSNSKRVQKAFVKALLMALAREMPEALSLGYLVDLPKLKGITWRRLKNLLVTWPTDKFEYCALGDFLSTSYATETPRRRAKFIKIIERALLEAKTPGALWLRKHGKRYKL